MTMETIIYFGLTKYAKNGKCQKVLMVYEK